MENQILTVVDSLKQLYEAMGGTPSDVERISTVTEMIQELSEIAGGGGGGGSVGAHVIALTNVPTSTAQAILPSGVTYASILADLENGTIPMLKVPTASSGNYIYAAFISTYTVSALHFAYWELIATQSGTTGIKLTLYSILSNSRVKQDAYNINFAS
jgi:hypothetical protein